ncbi:MAG: AI-2E family transporter [Candidatus Uhrbacteria bacterium]|nr:AI-2E family transporter [Candidatus Uhrbacteria bacterium]
MEPRVISISTETVLKTVGVLLALGAAWLIRDILLLLFSATLLAGILYPFADWASHHKIPKGLAVALLYLALFTLLTVMVGFLIPAIVDQARQASGTFGGTIGWLRDGATELRDVSEYLGLGAESAPSLSALAERVQESALNLVASLNNVLAGLTAVVVVLVLSFYLVIDDGSIKRAFRGLVPDAYHEFGTRLIWRVMEKLGAWARGQLALSASIGLAYFVGFSLLGVPYALLLALVAAVFEFVPYLGPITVGSAVVFIALTVSPWKALAALFFILVVQQLQNHIVTPLVMKKAVGLHPVASIAAFLVGAKLFGVVGAIFSIPVATALSVVLQEYVTFRKPVTSDQ